MEFVILNEKEFLDYSIKSKYTSFFQTPYWAEIKKTNGWDSHYVGMKKDGKLVAATLLLSKNIKFFKKMFYAPRGFLLDYNDFKLIEEFTLELKKYLKENNALFLKINPYLDYQERTVDGDVVPNTRKDDFFALMKKLGYKHMVFYINQDEKKDLEPRWISVLDLKDKTFDELFKEMRSSTKWRINNSKKNSLKIIDATYEELDEFKKLMKHTGERREFIDRPLSYYQNMYKVLKEKDLIKVLLIEINFKELKELSVKTMEDNDIKLKNMEGNKKKEGQVKEIKLEQERLKEKIKTLDEHISKDGDKKIISGGLYMLYGHEIIYLFGASYKDYMKYNAQYLLQYYMINYAKDHGYDAFNFYGIDGNFNKESKGYGLFDFKRGFDARVHELVGEFDLVISKNSYRLYKIAFSCYKWVKNLSLHKK